MRLRLQPPSRVLRRPLPIDGFLPEVPSCRQAPIETALQTPFCKQQVVPGACRRVLGVILEVPAGYLACWGLPAQASLHRSKVCAAGGALWPLVGLVSSAQHQAPRDSFHHRTDVGLVSRVLGQLWSRTLRLISCKMGCACPSFLVRGGSVLASSMLLGMMGLKGRGQECAAVEMSILQEVQ